MKKLSVFIIIFIFTAFIQAQTPVASNLAPKSDDPKPADNSASANKPGGKFNLPPEKLRPVEVVKFAAAPAIDGKLDEEMWKTAQVLKDFYQTSPGNNTAASKPTEVMVAYDEKNLYIGFRCFDEKDKIRATVAKRDQVTAEDNVRVWLDTYNDQRRAYVLAFNPYGIQQDGIFTEGQGSDFSVDIVMESKGVIEDWGWSVEVQIPFKSLRYTAGKGKLWGFNAARNIDRFNDELDQWLPDDRDISGFLIKHGKLSGLNEIKYERTLEVVPSITVSETGSRKRTLPISTVNNNGFDPIYNPLGLRDFGRFTNDSIKTELGVNLKYTISPNVTLDAAINPDFAEVEADAVVNTANQRFPIYFEEKRPFFLEGKEIFESPLSPFYSRTIVDPDLAVKLSGKTGPTSFGFLVASDNAPGNYSLDERNDPVSPPSREFLDKNAYFAVARVKRDIGVQNNIGFFGTARVFPRNRNFVGGFDGTVRLNPRTVMLFQVLGTHSRKSFYNPDLDRNQYRTGNGVGYFVNIDSTTDRHGWFIEASGRSSDYRTDAGFASRVNTNTIFLFNRFSTTSKPDKAIIRANWRQFVRYRYDWKGRTQNGLVGNGFNLSLQGNLFINGEGGLLWEKIYEDEFGARRNANQSGAFFGASERSAKQPYFSINFNKTVSKKFNYYGFVGSIFNAFDFDFGAGSRYPRASPAFQSYLNSPEYLRYIQLLYSNPNSEPNPFPAPPALDPGSGWQFDAEVGGEYIPINPLRISLNYQKSRLKRNDNNRVAFDTDIISLRSTYQFSRFTFLRTRVDYNTLNSNVSGQILAGYNPNPGTAFYIGYNDNFNYNGFSPFTGQLEPRFERNARTFFIRATYLFRKSF